MKERLSTAAANGLPENRPSTLSRASIITRGAALILLPLAVITACKNQEEFVMPENCPEGVHSSGKGSTDGFAPNTLVLLYEGDKVREDVQAVLEKYDACRDTAYIRADEEDTSHPYVVDPEKRDLLFNELKSFIDEGVLEDVLLASTLQY